MGGVQHRVNQIATDGQDPVPIARSALLDHMADLDEARTALDDGDTARAARLVDGVLGGLHDEVFPWLPDGRSTEEQDLAPWPQ